MRTLTLLAAAALLLAARRARRARRIELRGAVAVVTGGGRGLGLAIARALVREGCRVAICGRDGEVIERAVASLRARGADVFGAACDASDEGQARSFIHAVLDRFGRIDVLVNNAAQCFVGPAAELEAADVETAIRQIFWVQYHPTMAALPAMRARRAGRIVNVTSFGGKVPTPHQAAYTTGKFAATGWSHTLAAELRKDGIEVSTVAPPPLRDGAPLHVHFHGRTDEEFSWFTQTLTSPLRATSAEWTALVIVDAARHGDAERAVSVGSWLMARAFGLAPSFVSRALSRVDRRLPPVAPPGRHTRMRLGAEVAASSTNSRVRRLRDAAFADERRFLP